MTRTSDRLPFLDVEGLVHIRITHPTGFLLGSRFVSAADGPIEVDDGRGRALVAAGLAVACAPIEAEAPAGVERAVRPSKAERAWLARRP